MGLELKVEGVPSLTSGVRRTGGRGEGLETFQSGQGGWTVQWGNLKRYFRFRWCGVSSVGFVVEGRHLSLDGCGHGG